MAVPDDPAFLAAKQKCDDQFIERPPHYTYSAIEPISVIESWGLGFHLGCVVKYLCRAGRKEDRLLDLRKAEWYLSRYLDHLEQEQTPLCDEDEEDLESICDFCAGSGISRFSNRPDDFGPHHICPACRGTGTVEDDD